MAERRHGHNLGRDKAVIWRMSVSINPQRGPFTDAGLLDAIDLSLGSPTSPCEVTGMRTILHIIHKGNN